MTNIIDANGITIDSLEDLITAYSDTLRNIYGSDIVLDPESPDGLLVNFLAQVTRDASEFAVKLYNAESINSAVGSLLDQKVAWFGLTRKPASYSYVNVNITTINNVNLVGMDSNTNPPPNIYTVQDNSGNNYYLASSVSLSANTTTACSFRAENSGAVLVGAGTITTPVSYNQYITAINNPSSQYITGSEEESDTELKWRLKSSYYLPSQGFCESMKSALLSYDDIQDAFVIDNPTNTTDAYGISPYSVWVIVDCPDNAQTQQEIGDVFAVQNTVGTPTYYYDDSGVTNRFVQRQDSQGLFTNYNYNLVDTEPVYVYINLTSTIVGNIIDQDLLKEAIIKGLGDFQIYGICNANTIIKLCTEFDSSIIVGECKLDTSTPVDPSDPTEYGSSTYVQPSNVNKKFTLDASDIYIYQS
ncbi:MAG: baseplate J/gp47 family protein [Methanobrevibacter sp.]|nr:baseplate J/gp47 family protein [Methanobrevibacter sp.]